MAVIEVNEKNFEEQVLKSDKAVLIDFNAGWCGPCRMLKPVIEQLSDELDGVKIVSVDIDENDALAESYEVSSIPCLVLVQNGEEIDRHVGYLPKERLIEFIGGR